MEEPCFLLSPGLISPYVILCPARTNQRHGRRAYMTTGVTGNNIALFFSYKQLYFHVKL